jgi:hypothetical protein
MVGCVAPGMQADDAVTLHRDKQDPFYEDMKTSVKEFLKKEKITSHKVARVLDLPGLFSLGACMQASPTRMFFFFLGFLLQLVPLCYYVKV